MSKRIRSISTVNTRQRKEKETILEHLRQIPIVQISCQKAGISRATFYRLRAEDESFKTSVEEAITEGVNFINDLSEGQLISLIKEKNWPAISFWLRSHHPSYKQRDFQAGFTITKDGDGTIFELFAELDPETKDLRDSYLQKKSENHVSRETKN